MTVTVGCDRGHEIPFLTEAAFDGMSHAQLIAESRFLAGFLDSGGARHNNHATVKHEGETSTSYGNQDNPL